LYETQQLILGIGDWLCHLVDDGALWSLSNTIFVENLANSLVLTVTLMNFLGGLFLCSQMTDSFSIKNSVTGTLMGGLVTPSQTIGSLLRSSWPAKPDEKLI